MTDWRRERLGSVGATRLEGEPAPDVIESSSAEQYGDEGMSPRGEICPRCVRS